MKTVAITYRNEKKLGPYADALWAVGLEPVLITPGQPEELPAGLLLAGGTDVDPAIYGQELDPRGDAPDRERDGMEQRMLRDALARDVPVLAICRGMQLFNVTHAGGTLAQHMEGHKLGRAETHHVEVFPRTRLARILGEGIHTVNSRHHQSVANPGQTLIVSAKSPDGVIEALERPDLKFAIAVQWHPEDQFPQYRRLFEAFRDAL